MRGESAETAPVATTTTTTTTTTTNMTRSPPSSSSSPRVRRRFAPSPPSRGARGWKMPTPTTLWSVVILAIAPGFFGLGGGFVGSFPTSAAASSGSSWGRSNGGRSASSANTELVSRVGGVMDKREGGAAVVGSGGGSGQQQKGQGGAFTSRFSPSGATSWFKERVRDGKRRINMQVMSMVPETQLDSKRFENAPVPVEERAFQINGWRWHSIAVLRDVNRFRRIALLAADTCRNSNGDVSSEVEAAVQRVAKGYGFMWTFSFCKLHESETRLFFPWLRKKLPKEALPSLAEFDREREAIVRIGNKIGKCVAEAQRASEAKTSPRAALLMCADLSEELYSKAARLSRAQEAVIVPLTSAYATSKEQWRFNDKTLLSLGIVNSQVFMVSMHDAIKADKIEFDNFRLQVPKFARVLIPTWRRLLYSPKAGALEETADVDVVSAR